MGTPEEENHSRESRLRVPLETTAALWLTTQTASFVRTLLGAPIEVSLEEGSFLTGSALVRGTPHEIAVFEETLHDIAGVYREVAGHEGASELSIGVALKSTFDLHRTRIKQGLEY